MGEPSRDRAPRPVKPGDSATKQQVPHEGPPNRLCSGGYQLVRPGCLLGLEGGYYLKCQTFSMKPEIFVKLQESSRTFFWYFAQIDGESKFLLISGRISAHRKQSWWHE